MVQKLKNNQKKNLFIKTFGCQMNEYDSERIEDILSNSGFERKNNMDNADCIVINTCHIREKSTDKIYHDVGRIKKKFRNKKKPLVIISGCVAQAEGEIILKKEKFVDAVIGPQSYHQINQLVSTLERKSKFRNLTEFQTIKKFDEIKVNRKFKNKISSFITIQEGCDKFCKFCVVPYTRGPEFSRNFNDIIEEANNLVNSGSREITLLGQNVNAYRSGEKKLSDLIIELEKIDRLKRIRYTTSHPNDMTYDLIEVHKTSKKLMPLLHLPVQSGSSRILKEMNRNHSIADYLKVVNRLKKAKPNIKFSSDFIIGYPSESNYDFEATINLLSEVKFINTYSYLFSPRPGTPAAHKKNCDILLRKKRLIKFQSLSDNIKLDYKKELKGKIVNVLFENESNKPNLYFGRDEYNNSVLVRCEKNIVGEEKKVKIFDYNLQNLFGSILNNEEKPFAA